MSGDGASSAPVKPVVSAYAYFQTEQYANHKDDFIGLSVGKAGAEIARRWKSMGTGERARYQSLHAEDRARFEMESRARDAEIAAKQAAKREARHADPTSKGYMRARALTRPAGSKKGRKVQIEDDMSPERLAARKKFKQQREEQKADRLAREAESDRQKKSIAAAAAAMARKRIKYILRQSDIFATHFGVTLSESEDEIEEAEKEQDMATGATARLANGGGTAALGSPSKRRHAERVADEVVEADANGDDKAPTYLVQQPPSITGGKLRPYQLEGLNWMINLHAQGTNGILADEMGLGKTLQSISILAYMRDFRQVEGPHIILLPKSVLGNWEREFSRFCPSIRVLLLSGTKDERAAIIRDSLKPGQPEEERNWNVLLTTYEVANIEKASLTKIGWRYLIIDEAHRLKNESSVFSMTVRELTTQFRLLLTGTPLQNNLHELWALLNFLLPTVFKDSEAFSRVFDLNVDDADKKQNMIKQLHKILRPFMLRRLKKEVEKSLPPKEETILFTGMSEMQRRVYKGVLMRDIDTVNGTNAGRTAILNIVMQLRKCCNHPYLFPNAEDRNLDPMGEHLVQNCGKMILLDKLLSRLKAAGHRVLIFSQMTRMMDILEDLMHMRDYEYCRIDGNTPHDVRQDLIEGYNSPGSDKFVFLLSTRAGGLGINLQSADTCILYDSDWNPQADLQAQDRCHRIGQTKTVKVYRLVTEDTIEEKVVERAQQKLKLDAMVVQRGMLQGEKKLEKDEMLAAIRFGADAVFRAKDNVLSDQDLDAVLERGAKKTKEMQEKLDVADKGDMLDFKFDDNSGVQRFEGINYADRKLRDQMRAGFVDIGPRERKPAAVKAYAPPPLRVEAKKSMIKLPKELELPQMKDYQMFKRERIVALQEKLQDKFKSLKDGCKIPADCEDIASLLLPPEEVLEREELIAQGFPTWTRNHFLSFVDGMSMFGRERLDLVAPMVGKPVEEVKRYGEALWRVGPKTFTPDGWRRIRTRVEMREKKLAETNRLMMTANELIEAVEDPWNNLEVRINQRQAGGNAVGMQLQKEWTKDEDRYLLCLTHQFGWGNWHKVRACLRASPRFAFDYYLRSLSEIALGKHCEQLMKSSERYLQDLQERNKKEAKREAEERAALVRDEASAAREDTDFENRLRNMESVLGCAEDELEEAETKQRDLEVIAEGVKSGSVSFDDPHVRTLLELCASNGIGTSGLYTRGKAPATAEADRGSPGPVSGSGSGSGSGSISPRSRSTSPAGTKNPQPPVGKDSAVSTSKEKVTSSATRAETKEESSSTNSVPPSKAAKSATSLSPDPSRARTLTRPVGKPGLELPKALFPELARMIESAGVMSKDEMFHVFQDRHPAYTQVAISKAASLLGKKVSRGSSWETSDAGKKYLAMPVHEGSLPEEVAVLAAVAAKRKSGGSKAQPSKKRKSTTPNKEKEGVKSPITKFFPPKRKEANGIATPPKKRKALNSKDKGGAVGSGTPGTPSIPGASAGFVAFCRANKTRVHAEMPTRSKTDIVDRLVYLWEQLEPAEVERWNAGRLPAVAGKG